MGCRFNIEELLTRKRECKSDWLILQAECLSRYAKEHGSATSLVYSALEARNAIEQLFLELIFTSQNGKISKKMLDECRKNDGVCYVPSTWIEAVLRETAKEFKGKGKASLKATILASVFVEPEEIPLGRRTYDEIDRRPAVIQRQRIIKSRPRFNSWEIEFTINFDETRIKMDTLKQILIEAGNSKGIGDYRPKFGRFELVNFV